MDKLFQFADDHPVLFYAGILVIDLAVLFGIVLGSALIVKAVFF